MGEFGNDVDRKIADIRCSVISQAKSRELTVRSP